MILVTGAAGFIGSHVVDRLLADGHRVLGLDNFDPNYPRAIKEANLAGARQHPAFAFAEADLLDPDALERALASIAPERIDAIIHLAARTGVRASISDPLGYHQTNLIGTLRLLELARLHGVRQFVFGSSSSIYGVNPRVPWHEEDRDILPISPYANTKLSGEMLGHVYAATHGVRFIALRFFTVYGPRQRPDLAIARFVEKLRAGQPLPRYGDGSSRRDYTFVADIVDGIVRALAYTATPFEIINLGNHQTVSLGDLITAIGATFERTPAIEALPEQAGDVPRTWADVAKAGRLLGWHPRTDLAAGLRAYRAWLER